MYIHIWNTVVDGFRKLCSLPVDEDSEKWPGVDVRAEVIWCLVIIKFIFMLSK